MNTVVEAPTPIDQDEPDDPGLLHAWPGTSDVSYCGRRPRPPVSEFSDWPPALADLWCRVCFEMWHRDGRLINSNFLDSDRPERKWGDASYPPGHPFWGDAFYPPGHPDGPPE